MKNSVLRDALVTAGLKHPQLPRKVDASYDCYKGNSSSKSLLINGGLVGFDKVNDVGFPSVQAALNSSQYAQLKSLISKEPEVYYLQDKSSYWLFFPIKGMKTKKQESQISNSRPKQKKKEPKTNRTPKIKLICEEQIRKSGGEFAKEYIVSSIGFQSLDMLKKSGDYWALTFSQRGAHKPVIEVFKSTDGLFRFCKKKSPLSSKIESSQKLEPTAYGHYQEVYDSLHKRGIPSRCDIDITKILDVIKDLENIKDVSVFKERLGIPMVIGNPTLNRRVNKFYKLKDLNFNRIGSFIELLLSIDKEELTRVQNKIESIKSKKTEGTDAKSILKERKELPKIGLGLEAKFKPERIRTQDVKLDEKTKTIHDKHIIYTAGWTLDGAFTKE